MTAYENITALLDRIEEVSKTGDDYHITLEDVEQIQEAQEQVKNITYKPVLCGVISDDEIADHIRTNCRHSNGDKAMDEQAFYEGAKWMRGTLKP